MRKKPEASLRLRAMQYLARREFSRAQLRGKLLVDAPADEGGVPLQPADVEALLDDLATRGLISDERTATEFIDAKRHRFGAQRIVRELRQKGISEELIGDALPRLRETELAAAREVWKKKFGRLPANAKEKARQARFLQSRGFAQDVISRMLRLGDDPEDWLE